VEKIKGGGPWGSGNEGAVGKRSSSGGPSSTILRIFCAAARTGGQEVLPGAFQRHGHSWFVGALAIWGL